MAITYNYLFVLIAGLILVGFIAITDAPQLAQKSLTKIWHSVLILLLLAAIIYLCFSNFPVTLTLLTAFSGLFVLLDILFWAKKRKKFQRPAGTIIKNAREFFPVLLLVWVIRSFIMQPYHVPTGSLEPTVMPGDFITVKQYPYGLKFPIGNATLIKTGAPQTGDIVLFYNPVNPQLVFVKRLIGTPGDHIVYKNKVLSVNGKEATQQLLANAQDIEPGQTPIPVNKIEENLNGIKHLIYVWPQGGETDNFDIIVPPGMYFMMGDNRDNSDDSRTGFGSGTLAFVPERNIIGKAWFTVMGWNADTYHLGWDRTGKKIN